MRPLIQIIRRERPREDRDVPGSMVALLLSTLVLSSGGLMEQTPPWLVIPSLCATIQVTSF